MPGITRRVNGVLRTPVMFARMPGIASSACRRLGRSVSSLHCDAHSGPLHRLPLARGLRDAAAAPACQRQRQPFSDSSDRDSRPEGPLVADLPRIPSSCFMSGHGLSVALRDVSAHASVATVAHRGSEVPGCHRAPKDGHLRGESLGRERPSRAGFLRYDCTPTRRVICLHDGPRRHLQQLPAHRRSPRSAAAALRRARARRDALHRHSPGLRAVVQGDPSRARSRRCACSRPTSRTARSTR